MSCPSSGDDAAYVLGALSPRERLDFEHHLDSCPECAARVRDLAGLPGLLRRVDPAVLEEVEGGGPPLPDTILPALVREVEQRATARRRRLVAGLAVAAVALVALTVPAVGSWLDPEVTPPPAGSAAPEESGPPARAMEPVGEVPVRATLAVEPVAWGTRLVLDCTYDTASVPYDLPPRVDYVLVVRTADGRTEQVGSWESVDGESMTLDAGTASREGDITSVQVRIPDGRVVLRLPV
ncbi:zf-HC2 domain-containing protein [Nocardioides aestuarii]|uniref:Anti-sigma factor family protein n=1 Tax=Nocardioides aestuarii TaxID=252231 RepID=A0ABW4TJR4_9ACTN